MQGWLKSQESILQPALYFFYLDKNLDMVVQIPCVHKCVRLGLSSV